MRKEETKPEQAWSLGKKQENQETKPEPDKVTETNDEQVAKVVKAKVKGGVTDMTKVFIVHTNGFHRDDDGRNPSQVCYDKKEITRVTVVS